MSQFSFENQGTNSFLVYSMDMTDEIDHIGLGMINNNKIPNILPIAFNQIDERRSFRYNISSTVSLSSFLGGTICRQLALNMFGSICDAFMQAEDYLLDSNLLVIDPQYIFVEPVSGTAQMIYLAVIRENETVDLPALFKRLIISIKSDSNEDCGYIAAILNHLNTNDNFSLPEFKKMLNGLGTVQSVPREKLAAGAIKGTNSTASNKKTAESATGGTSGRIRQKPAAPREDEIPDRRIQTNESSRETKKAEDVPVTPQKPAHTEEYGFEVPGGGHVSITSTPEKKQPGQTKQAGDKDVSLIWLLRNFSGENLELYKSQQKQKENGKPEKKQAKPKKKKAQKKENQVLVLTSLDQTHPYSWPVNGDSFTIGRRRTNNGILADVSNKISREHCAIIKENGSYYVVDQNSRYGTIVDGVLYQGNEKRAELHDGSIIEFPGILFKVSFH